MSVLAANLASAAGAVVGQDAFPQVGPGEVAVVLRTEPVLSAAAERQLRDHVQQGGRAVLVGPPVGPGATDGLGQPLLAAPSVAGLDPLVAVAVVEAAGAGPWAGLAVRVGGPAQVQGRELATVAVAAGLGGRAVALAEQFAVVAETDLGSGTVVRMPGSWADRLGEADNALAFVRAITGRVDPALERVVEKIVEVSGERPGHPEVPVVHSGPFDLSLLADAGEDVNAAAFSRAAAHSTRLLPAQVHDALVDFADAAPDAGALVLRGIPIGQVPATPTVPGAAHKTDRVSELALLTVARRLGQPVGYAPEHGGDLVQNVSPVKASADRQISTSYKGSLEFHTEAAFHPHRPRYLLLLCLRGDPQAATTLCSVHAVLPALSARDRAVLSSPRFTTGIDESYTGAPSPRRSAPRPILTGDPARPALWLDADLMRGTDLAAQGALDRLAALVREEATGVVLAAGDLLVVDNTMAVHGRSPFTPRFDGTDRWLQRTFVLADHTAADGERAGRIVGTRFVA